MSYPKTYEEYWQQVEENASLLQDWIASFHPFYARPNLHYKITAEVAEKVCQGVRDEIAQREQEDPQVLFTRYRNERNPEIVSLFNQTWFGIPESSDVRYEPGFGMFCDLCSEGYLADPDWDKPPEESEEIVI